MGDDPVLLHELWRTRKSGIAPGLAAVLLAVIFLFGTAMGDEAPLKLMIVSDIHYLAPSLYENSDGLFENVMKRADGKMTHYSRELLEGLMREARHQHPDAMIVSGDLSFNGEKESHLELAEAFEKLSAEGIPVWVIPRNHDINYPYAGQYIEDRYEPVPNVSPKEFRDIYNPFMIPDQAGKNHMSYAIKLRDWLWLAMCDASIYDPLPASGGLYTGENATWLQVVLDEAKAAGAQVITVTHQSLIPHTAFMLSAMTIENGSLMAEQMRLSGNARLNLSGHLHIQHISEADGLYDIATGAFSVPPFRYGMLTVRENGAAEYEARALCEAHMPQDMARLAKNWFEATVKAKERALLEALGLPEENRERMLEYAAKLNHAYFSGDFVSTDPVWTEDPAFRLWTEIREKDSMARYLTELPGSFENARSALRLALPVMNGGR